MSSSIDDELPDVSFSFKPKITYVSPLFYEVESPSVSRGHRAFLYSKRVAPANLEYRCTTYVPYFKVERSFFQVYQMLPNKLKLEEGEEPTTFLFTTPYPVRNLHTSLLGYRSLSSKEVSALQPSSKLIMRNKTFLVFRMDNGCVLITSQDEHPGLASAMSSNL